MKRHTTGNKEVANFLKEKRLAADLSQGDVRKELGYSTPQFVSNWERGLAHPPHADIKRIAELFGCDVNQFCEDYVQLMIKAFEKDLRSKVNPKKKK